MLILVSRWLCIDHDRLFRFNLVSTEKRVLRNYEMLKPIKDDDGAKSLRRSVIDWTSKATCSLSELKCSSRKTATSKRESDPADLKILTDYSYKAFVKEMKPSIQIVKIPGPSVIGARMAIVDLVPTELACSIAGALMPYDFVVEIASGPASRRPFGSPPPWATCIEVQIIDGGSG